VVQVFHFIYLSQHNDHKPNNKKINKKSNHRKLGDFSLYFPNQVLAGTSQPFLKLPFCVSQLSFSKIFHNEN